MDGSHNFKCRRSIIALFFKALGWLIPISIWYILLHFLATQGHIIIASKLPAITFFYRLVCVAILLEMLRLFFNDLYIFGSNRIVNMSGIISLNARRTSITYEDIRDVGINQSLLGRIFNYGSVMLGTAALDAYEIEFKDLNDPAFVADYVRERMNLYKTKVSTADVFTTNNE